MTNNNYTYSVLDLPAASDDVLAAFNDLPADIYTNGQRFRRFSQFRLDHDEATGSWKLTLLPYRPFIQPKNVNRLVGGVQRKFEPLAINPEPQIVAGAAALDLPVSQAWQVNVHQCRVIANTQIQGVSVPEGPHRDGHDYGMLAVFGRHNIDGGENQLMPTGGGEPFFRVTLQPGQALVYDDGQMWHYATDIVPTHPDGGHRDLWIVAFNRWEHRKYGEEFEADALA
ncbi:MAG TPA: 2OG-Fe dioxygenase family protein [Streptosporangiaceae bacterium]|nr:2OG-Fe dioxygenase family protein [Streptosporangiaceae bacterium]